jgi:hypothetical protein
MSIITKLAKEVGELSDDAVRALRRVLPKNATVAQAKNAYERIMRELPEEIDFSVTPAASRQRKVPAAPRTEAGDLTVTAPKRKAKKSLAVKEGASDSAARAAIGQRNVANFTVPAAPRTARPLEVQTAPTNVRDLSKIAFDPETYGLRKGEMGRLKDLAVKVEHNRIVPQGPSLGVDELADNFIIGTMSDRSGANTTITGIGPTDLDIPVHEYGGQDFMPANPGLGWAVSTPGVASGIMNRAMAYYKKTGKLPLLAPYRMAGTGTDFSKTTGELMMSQANSAFGGDDRARVNAVIGNYIRDFKGIDNPEGYLQYGALPTEQRKALQEALHRDTAFTESGGLSLPLTRALITDPAQIDKPSYMIQNIGVLDPRREVVVDFSRNPTYGYNLPVEFMGTVDPDINIAEIAHGMLNKKYADLGDLSGFRGQQATLSLSEWRRQQKEYRAAKEKYEAAIAAGKDAKPPREPVRAGNTQKFLQPGVSGFLDDVTAQAIKDRLSKLGL